MKPRMSTAETAEDIIKKNLANYIQKNELLNEVEKYLKNFQNRSGHNIFTKSDIGTEWSFWKGKTISEISASALSMWKRKILV